MKIVVISDTHIPKAAADLPAALYDDLGSADLIIHSGDIVDMSFLEQLKSIAPVRAVCGNMDPPALQKALPEKEVVTAGKFRIGVIHGAGHPDEVLDFVINAFKDDGVDAVIFGHTHKALNAVKDGVLYFNPGSPTDKVYAKENSYGVIEVGEKIVATIKRLGQR